MTLLHVHFKLRNLQGFKAAIHTDASSDRSEPTPAPSTSGGRSWSKSTHASSLSATNGVNKFDAGCTVLHLACASKDGADLEYVRLLLAHPSINVNLQDVENRWTALHRALYHGNIPAALLILRRQDTDPDLKDFEGYTAYDLYNSTIEHSKPASSPSPLADLYTWGTNSNFTLGLGDGNDRAYPELVPLPQPEQPASAPIYQRFRSHRVRQTAMSRLHSAVIISESNSNLRLCGFGSGGRLGPGQHIQYSFTTLPQFTHTVVSVALGQDHTLVLTSTGEIYSWGLNRFSQLGYPVENTTQGRLEEPIQLTPRRILCPYRKDWVVEGVAASKVASACWTSLEVFTWGTNNGQLGYDRMSAPAQLSPRKVASLEQPVTSITMTDFGMACLLKSYDVILFYSNRHSKVNFPANAFPAEMKVYRPMRAVEDFRIVKIMSCDDNMAAMSANGELFMFSVPDPSKDKDRGMPRASRVWALRKQFSAVKDAALGADGSVVICTDSGHAFVRSRKAQMSAAGKTFKFRKIPYIHRVVAVSANNAGAFAAHRVEFEPRPIHVGGNVLSEDLAAIQPYLARLVSQENAAADLTLEPIPADPDTEDQAEDPVIAKDTLDMKKLLLLLSSSSTKSSSAPGSLRQPHGADIQVEVGQHAFPCHTVVLMARSPTFRQLLLSPKKAISSEAAEITLSFPKGRSKITSLPRIVIQGAHSITVLILLFYLYSDRILAIWDRRISASLQSDLTFANIRGEDMRVGLQKLASVMELPALQAALQYHVRTEPTPTMPDDLAKLYSDSQREASRLGSSPDVLLQLKDQVIRCYSTILRARSPFFADLFGDEDWTRHRKDANGVVTVDLAHLESRVMVFVLRFMCQGDEDIFDVVENVSSVDELLDLTFDVMAAANELLLDRLTHICAAVILRYLTPQTACFILSDATHLNAKQMVDRVQHYVSVNLELFLQSRLLEDLPFHLTKLLSRYIHAAQNAKSPFSRGDAQLKVAMEKHRDWLATEDFPTPLVRSARSRKESRISPKASRVRINAPERPSPGPSVRPQRSVKTQPSFDDIFSMEEDVTGATASLSNSRKQSVDAITPTHKRSYEGITPSQKPGWGEVSSVKRMGMTEIMAAETAKQARAPEQGPSTPPRMKPSDRADLTSSRPPAPSQGSWRAIPTPPKHSLATPTLQSSGNHSKTTTPARNTASSATPQAQQTPPRAGPALGPTYAPQTSPSLPKTQSPSVRRTPSGPAWRQSQTATPPIVSPTTPTGPIRSFLAIQQLQIDEVITPPQAKKSLLDIQAEEHERQEEADFLRWWEEEEQRTRAEAEAAVAAAAAASTSRASRGKKRAPTKPRGEDEQGSGKRGHRKPYGPKRAQPPPLNQPITNEQTR